MQCLRARPVNCITATQAVRWLLLCWLFVVVSFSAVVSADANTAPSKTTKPVVGVDGVVYGRLEVSAQGTLHHNESLKCDRLWARGRRPDEEPRLPIWTALSPKNSERYLQWRCIMKAVGYDGWLRKAQRLDRLLDDAALAIWDHLCRLMTVPDPSISIVFFFFT